MASLAGLLTLLDPNDRFRSDGGGVVIASRKALTGAERVGGAMIAMTRHSAGSYVVRIVSVNGAPGLLVEQDGQLTVVAFTIDRGLIQEIDAIRNPAELGHIGRAI